MILKSPDSLKFIRIEQLLKDFEANAKSKSTTIVSVDSNLMTTPILFHSNEHE